MKESIKNFFLLGFVLLIPIIFLVSLPLLFMVQLHKSIQFSRLSPEEQENEAWRRS